MADDTKVDTTKAEKPVTAASESIPVSDIEKMPAVAKHEGDVIEAWFKDHFVGTKLGGSTELYNLGYEAKEDLKKRLPR